MPRGRDKNSNIRWDIANQLIEVRNAGYLMFGIWYSEAVIPESHTRWTLPQPFPAIFEVNFLQPI